MSDTSASGGVPELEARVARLERVVIALIDVVHELTSGAHERAVNPGVLLLRAQAREMRTDEVTDG